MNINELISNNTNLIEIFITNKITNNNRLDIDISKHKIDKIKNKYNFKQYNYRVIYRNNLIYTYDLNNDSQIVNEKKLEKIINNNKYSIIVYNDNKYPTYLFPCTNDIDHKTNIILNEYKLNNRISLFIRNENDVHSIYIQYKHSNNVDIEKMENIINDLLNKIINYLS